MTAAPGNTKKQSGQQTAQGYRAAAIGVGRQLHRFGAWQQHAQGKGRGKKNVLG